jgi:hypothetical protein
VTPSSPRPGRPGDPHLLMPLPLRQAAIVAYHGGAPQPLAALLRAVQALVAGELGAGFRPRPLAAVHATLVGLERTEHGEPVNLNRHALTESDDAMDLAGLFGHLCSLLRSGGLTVRFGGFSDRDYRISSRGTRLYQRSFILDRGRFVLIGWPTSRSGTGGEPTLALDEIRRSAQRFNVVHKYHPTPDAVDADCYLVVGACEPPDLAAAELAGVQHRVREFLVRNPTSVGLAAADLSLVAYTDVALPEETTLALPLCGGEREALALFANATRPPQQPAR